MLQLRYNYKLANKQGLLVMGGMNAVYSRDKIDDRVQSYGITSLLVQDGWYCYYLTTDVSELPAYATDSSELVFLSFHSVVEAFYYKHVVDGESQRELKYGCMEQGVWEIVNGSPEDWEENAFDDDDIESDSFEPIVDSREASRAAAEFFGFPDWK